MACIPHVTRVVWAAKWCKAFQLRLALSGEVPTQMTQGAVVAAAAVAVRLAIPAVDLHGTVIDSVVGAVAVGLRVIAIADGIRGITCLFSTFIASDHAAFTKFGIIITIVTNDFTTTTT